MRSCSIFIFLLVTSYRSYCQIIKTEDLIGKWEINDITGIHKNFRVAFTFQRLSLLREDINDSLVSYELYRLAIEKGKSALVFMNSDTSVKNEIYHSLSLNGDTLRIGNVYYPYKTYYDLRPKDSIYFIRSRMP
jgi:hypothetical protein